MVTNIRSPLLHPLLKVETTKTLMNNLPHKIPRKPLFAFTICFLTLIPLLQAQQNFNFLYIDCPNANLSTTSTYAPNSAYQTNLNTLLSVISSNSNDTNGFFNFTAGSSTPDVVYGLFLCRGDFNASSCQECVVSASRDVVERCPRSKRVTIWYDPYCMIRYSHRPIFSAADVVVAKTLSNGQTVTNPILFREVLGKVMDDIVARASTDDWGKKFATAERKYGLQTVYGLAQCTPDLSDFDCNDCLQNGISTLPSCCDATLGSRVLSPSCYVHYEMHAWYDASIGAAPPNTTTPSSPGNRRISRHLIVAIVVPIAVAVMLFIAGCCFLTRRAKKKKYNSLRDDNGKISRRKLEMGDDISTVQSLQYDLGTVQVATNNFSYDNVIGEGGFGLVYKGLLPDGQEVAVKRLSRSSRQGALEFKNEMVLVAKLQHRNLVRLLGFCLEGEEKILIYEFVPNKSLDYFLFDPQEQVKLDWSRRYKIIGGVARGMLYLHEDSQLRIIHRDLKASNILLDGDMNAKVSDFGIARIFGVDQTQGNTSQVVGTFGYMSPEYAMHGQFSIKFDVFSFGVLVLEIISGRKNNYFHKSNGAEDLLSYAWELWRAGTPLDLMDPSLEGSYPRIKVTRCIHIALLCVQNDPDERPSMATTVLMLNSNSSKMSLPQQPGVLGRSITGSNILKERELNQSTSKSIEWSMNEASIIELHPS